MTMSQDRSNRFSNRTQPVHLSVEILSILGIIGLALGIWEAVVRMVKVPSYLLPAPSQVAHTLVRHASFYATASLITFGEAAGGLAVGIVLGTMIAIAITFRTHLARGVLALAILVKATPIAAIAPLLIIWLGFGPLPKILIVGLMTFFPVLINVHVGLQAVDQSVLDLLHSLDASAGEVFRHARWPSALPYLFAALRVVAPLSLVGAVVAEWAGASAGLGRTMWLAYTEFNLPSLFAAVLCSALMGIGLHGIVIVIERWVIFWH
jgi:ABC-type nitrate/sulfonate/bicarbonate transport system permease component